MNHNLPIKIDLPEHFLDEEMRCDFMVSSIMKKVWAVELDLLHELMRVCDKYHLRYFADGGTMLGAVRHNGFIPWDDDIDICMFRDDYDKLCNVAAQEFISPYFFSTELTDPGVARGFARLRNSATTAIMQSHLKYKFSFNQGIFVDIFPMDNVPDDQLSASELYKSFSKAKQRCGAISSCTFMYRPKLHAGKLQYFKHHIKHLVYSVLGMKNMYGKSVERMYAVMSEYRNLSTPFVAELMWFSNPDKRLWQRDWYADSILMPFEMLSIPVPVGYNHYLSTLYGDWHQFVRGGAIHGEMFFDAEKPYTEYIK